VEDELVDMMKTSLNQPPGPDFSVQATRAAPGPGAKKSTGRAATPAIGKRRHSFAAKARTITILGVPRQPLVQDALKLAGPALERGKPFSVGW